MAINSLKLLSLDNKGYVLFTLIRQACDCLIQDSLMERVLVTSNTKPKETVELLSYHCTILLPARGAPMWGMLMESPF